MQHTAQKIALCGILGSLALAMMLAGNLLAVAVYLCPAAAGLLILPIAWETEPRTGWLFFAGLALTSLLLLPDKEPAVLFCALLGYYPLVRSYLQRLRFGPLRWACKLLLFNGAMLAAYWVLLHLFTMPALQADMAQLTGWLLPVFMGLANLTFVFYDILIGRFEQIYRLYIHPRLEKSRRR